MKHFICSNNIFFIYNKKNWSYFESLITTISRNKYHVWRHETEKKEDMTR